MGFVKVLIRFLLGGGITFEVGKKREVVTTKNSYKNDFVSRDETSIKTIDEVVTSLFDVGYDVKRNMPLSGKDDDECKCSYIIFDDEDNIKMIIQLVTHNGDRNRIYYNIKKVCEVNNIKFLPFYTHMTNERSYVEERIKAAL